MSRYDAHSPAGSTSGLVAWLRGFLAPAVPPETPVQAEERRGVVRATAGAEIARIEAERDRELPALAAAEAKARRHLDAVTPGYREAVAAYDRAQAAHSRRAHDLAYAVERARRRVVAAAEPVIAEFVSGLMTLLDATLATKVWDEERNRQYDVTTNRDLAEVWSNALSIDARRIAILAARDEAEAMKADADQSTVRDRLAALVEALPSAELMVKVRDYPTTEPARPWPSYKASREELLGRSLDDPADQRRNMRRSGLSRVMG